VLNNLACAIGGAALEHPSPPTMAVGELRRGRLRAAGVE
jgi:hypothetical protein